MSTEQALQGRVEQALNAWLLATGTRLRMGERAQSELLLARFFNRGGTEEQLRAVRRRLAPAPSLVELLELDAEQNCARFARELALTGPEWFRPEVIAPPPEPVRTGTPEEERAARQRALAHLREAAKWIKGGCVGPGPGGITA